VSLRAPRRSTSFLEILQFWQATFALLDLSEGGWVMNVHKAPFAYTLLILIACALFPKVATAQYAPPQCMGVQRQLTKALEERAFKKLVDLQRRYLTYCKERWEGDDEAYARELGMLAFALNNDSQHEEALAVANRCLEIATDLSCLAQKVEALTHLGRVSEAKSIAERALSLGAVTQEDAMAKEELKQSLSMLTTLPDVHWVTKPPKQITSSGAQVPLKKDGGAFVVPVQINGALTLDFTLDSGAAVVTVPSDVFSTLRRTGTINDADITGEQTYVLADGAKTKGITFTIRSLRVGDKVVENVRGSSVPVQGGLLLGQSFLERFKSWSFDNTTHQLRLESQ